MSHRGRQGTSRGRGTSVGATVATNHNNTNTASRGRRQGHAVTSSSTRELLPRAKANTRPAQIVLDNTIQRRTSEQVQRDKETKRAAAEATAQANQIAEDNGIQRIAAIEDGMRREDEAYKKNAARPDLQADKAKGADYLTCSS